jgi:acetyl-CoA carboxylase biotin carboxylase subunit
LVAVLHGPLLVANRGEIARRILRTAKALGVRTVAVYSGLDAHLPFVREADEAVPLEGPPAEVYRDIGQILEAAKQTRAAAVHPGYGFLSENPVFARAVVDSGLIWVGPSAAAIEVMGDKLSARRAVAADGVPVAPGSDEPVSSAEQARAAAEELGLPIMLKAAAGGGGLGMAVVSSLDALDAERERITGFAERLFGDRRVFVERYYPRVRHVEVQVLGLGSGEVIALGERDCSVQRRNQKVVEETPSPALDDELRAAMCEAAIRAAETVGYRNAGTVEFLLDPASREFYFLEMNTRLQVEHPITEMVYGLDLVAAQLRIAVGMEPELGSPQPSGHAIELRVNAEDPVRFLPRPGAISTWSEPTGPGVRVDAGYASGCTVSPAYDSLLAKLVVHGEDRAQALARARAAVASFGISGPERGGVTTNLPFLAELLDFPEFVSGDYDTGVVGRMR